MIYQKIYIGDVMQNKTLNITADQEFKNCIVQNLIKSDPGLVWQSNDNNWQFIYIDFPNETPIAGVAIFNHRIIEEYFKFHYSTDREEYVNTPLTYTPQNIFGEYTLNNRYYRLRLYGPTLETFQLGKVILFEKVSNIMESAKWGVQEGYVTNYDQIKFKSGHVERKKKYKKYIYQGEYEVSKTTAEAYVEAGEQEYCCFFPKYNIDPNIMYYGYLKVDQPKEIGVDLYTTRVYFEECPHE